MTLKKNNDNSMEISIPYKASLTREQFLFYEMRTTAKILSEGFSEEKTVEKIVEENLFQYPTERSIKGIAKACINRLKLLNEDTLVEAIATQPTDIAKQICLYALMKYNGIVWDFMITVIGEKYRLRDSSFGKIDLNVFFMRLQEQNDAASIWSDSTITKLKQVLTKLLVDNEYIENTKADRLNRVWLNPILENAIRDNGDLQALPAFNCFS